MDIEPVFHGHFLKETKTQAEINRQITKEYLLFVRYNPYKQRNHLSF